MAVINTNTYCCFADRNGGIKFEPWLRFTFHSSLLKVTLLIKELTTHSRTSSIRKSKENYRGKKNYLNPNFVPRQKKIYNWF
jgi:hypothetical protein